MAIVMFSCKKIEEPLTVQTVGFGIVEIYHNDIEAVSGHAGFTYICEPEKKDVFKIHIINDKYTKITIISDETLVYNCFSDTTIIYKYEN